MMRMLRTALVLFVVLACNARATTIFLNSNSTAADARQFNNLGNDVLITPHSAWNPNGAGLWISYADTGVGGSVSPPNASDPITLPNPTAPTATFFLTFSLPYAGNSGTLSVWADDTARVWVDSILLIDANPTQGSACADAPVSCTTANGAVLSLSGLAQGDHTLRFDVYQRGNGPFGLQYEGFIESVPEPAAFMLLGAGLAALFLRRRAQRT
jgi:hypothetical protein